MRLVQQAVPIAIKGLIGVALALLLASQPLRWLLNFLGDTDLTLPIVLSGWLFMICAFTGHVIFKEVYKPGQNAQEDDNRTAFWAFTLAGVCGFAGSSMIGFVFGKSLFPIALAVGSILGFWLGIVEDRAAKKYNVVIPPVLAVGVPVGLLFGAMVLLSLFVVSQVGPLIVNLLIGVSMGLFAGYVGILLSRFSRPVGLGFLACTIIYSMPYLQL